MTTDYRVCVQYGPESEWKCHSFSDVEMAHRYYVEIKRTSPSAKIRVSHEDIRDARLGIVNIWDNIKEV